MAPCKCLILLALLLSFFFVAANATARSFGVMESGPYESGQKGHDSSNFKPSEDGVQPEPEEVGDLAEMDYTPPRKKPPIHN